LVIEMRHQPRHIGVTPAGPLLIRQFEQHGLSLQSRRPGQFTEMYTRLSEAPVAAKALHRFNRWWARVGPAWGSFGTVLTFRRPQG
jgi:hypothetical protein